MEISNLNVSRGGNVTVIFAHFLPISLRTYNLSSIYTVGIANKNM